MTEYDVNDSTIMEFMVSMVAFWLLFTVAVVVLYVAWSYVIKAYWKVAEAAHRAFVKSASHNGFDGYKRHRNRLQDHK